MMTKARDELAWLLMTNSIGSHNPAQWPVAATVRHTPRSDRMSTPQILWTGYGQPH